MKHFVKTPRSGTSKEKPGAPRSFNQSAFDDKKNAIEHASSSRGREKQDVSCFRCGLEGHMAYECLKKNKEARLNMINEEVDDSPIYDTDGEGEILQEVCEPDSVAESLVIRRVLAAPKSQDENHWLRTNIFHTHCTAYGKICEVLIDSGSCENMVARGMVDT